MAAHSVPITIRRDKQQKAVVFIHGFSGSAHQTFGMFPAFLAGMPALYDWDIYCFGYATSLAPDITGIWSSDPDLAALALHFTTAMTGGAFAPYSEVAVIAHSMGGLILQRALLDGEFENRVKSVCLFGVPSAGVRTKAPLGSFWKKQVKDMVPDGPFITELRAQWQTRYAASLPFRFVTVAGLSDDFVLSESSQRPFPKQYWRGVSGNHVEIVKPERADSDSVLIVLQSLTQATPHAPTPPDRSTVRAALAIEAVDGTEAALAYLYALPSKDTDTDIMGAIGGRHKRLWLGDPVAHAGDGPSALGWYEKGYARARGAHDLGQACYHGINTAFLQLALEKNPELAIATANDVLTTLNTAPPGLWISATRGEAHLYRHDVPAAVQHYQDALDANPTAREIGSMYQQALWVARLTKNEAAEIALTGLFGSRI